MTRGLDIQRIKDRVSLDYDQVVADSKARLAAARAEENATGGEVAPSASTSGDPTTPKAKETVMGKNTAPPIGADDITHYRHIIAGGPGNERQKITVEVISLVDNGVTTPPILTTHGNLDMSPDQAIELVDALERAQAAYNVALASHWESLR